MLHLLDGPVAGVYSVRRAPIFLRAVVTVDGKRDVLDALEDEAQPDEQIYVYRQIAEGPKGYVWLCGRGPGGSGRFAMGMYRQLVDVDGEQLRGTEDWRAWCLAQATIEMPS